MPGRGRIENLKPWPKGVSGNYRGRPRDLLSAALRKRMNEVFPIEKLRDPKTGELPAGLREKKRYTWADITAWSLCDAMLTGKSGSAAVFRELADRVEGKVADRTEVSGGDGGPVKISLDETLRKISEFYGLNPNSAD